MSAAELVDSSNLNISQQALWCLYLASAVMLPVYHVRPILRYLKGANGIGDACIRSEALQCCWRQSELAADGLGSRVQFGPTEFSAGKPASDQDGPVWPFIMVCCRSSNAP